ncbi:DUF802 domain-containing protein [Luteimonas sp. A277]
MKTNHLGISVFVLGLAAVAWVGLGYLGSNLPALLVTLLIAALYLVGALELYRYSQATATLEGALGTLDGEMPALESWLQGLHPSLRSPVQLRIEGGRGGLPIPALTPYLVGMLVLLGMLGTLLGMVLTLRGTGMALQTATDLQAVRDSLAAPVSGLGVAFGASIAGVASSAALGLMSALVRRERIQVVEGLDAHITTTLRSHSSAHQRAHQHERALELLQAQAATMPALVERLESMMGALEQQSHAAHEQQARQQDAFHASTREAYQQLAGSVGRSLETSAAEGARLAGQALVPVMESAMADMSRQATSVHEQVTASAREHLQAVSAELANMSRQATAAHDQVTASARDHLQALSAELAASTAGISQGWEQALSAQAVANQTQAAALGQALQAFEAGFSRRADELLERIGERMQAITDGTAAGWEQALTAQRAGQEALVTRQQQALDSTVEGFASQAGILIAGVGEAHEKLQQTLAERDEQRLATWRDSLAGISEDLRGQWAELTEQSRTHASDTVAEISTLMQAAAEGPRAAAETIAELRQSLSDSMQRDAAMLEERSRMLATLDTLLTAVNSASGEQRAAIEALVSTSSELLERVGSRFGEQIEAGETRLEEASTRLSTGVEEVATLGASLGNAVQAFSDSSAGLVDRLQAIEGALERSMERSDEQLAYYVAQAREVVDLSVLSQRQIIENLQQLAAQDELPGTVESTGADPA